MRAFNGVGMATILIISDEANARSVMREALEPNHIVAEASDAGEGLIVFNLFNPDVVITDAHMPIMSGLDFMRRFGAHSKKSAVSIIALVSDRQSQQETDDALKTGADLLLSRPLDVAFLKDAVRLLLSEMPSKGASCFQIRCFKRPGSL
jgi:DNA-binding response OmpR family regulator